MATWRSKTSSETNDLTVKRSRGKRTTPAQPKALVRATLKCGWVGRSERNHKHYRKDATLVVPGGPVLRRVGAEESMKALDKFNLICDKAFSDPVVQLLICAGGLIFVLFWGGPK